MQEEYDRLSCLPDDTIRHILSFLPTKTLVQTSSLAKRWRFLWADVPFFGFTCNGSSLLPTKSSISLARSLLWADVPFPGFTCNGSCSTSQTLTLVNTFHVCDPAGTRTDSDFDSWIAAIFSRKVRNLVIGFDSNLVNLRLPRRMFSCETLVDLIILNYCIVDLPDECEVHFPALKRLELARNGSVSEKFVSNLISGCPVIEEFVVLKTKVMMTTCCLLSPTLTRLAINADKFVVVKLDTPALTYLELRVRQRPKWLTNDPVEVEVDFSDSSLDNVLDAIIEVNELNISDSSYAIEILGKLRNVNCLSLFTGRMQIPDSEFLSLTTEFHNLAGLGLGADWRFIAKFIENASNLRTLLITRKDYHSTQPWIEPKKMRPECSLLSRLKDVFLYNFEWSTKNEFDMIKYICFEECCSARED